VVLDQIRTIEKQRIVKVLDKLSDKEILKLKIIIKEMLVD
jgi:mRNA interferase MazF